jgi:Protein of unknown function (DUF2281)
MSIQQLLITEVAQQPEPLLREVWHYLNFLKAKAQEESSPSSTVRPGFGSVPGIQLAHDFDAPLESFVLKFRYIPGAPKGVPALRSEFSRAHPKSP